MNNSAKREQRSIKPRVRVSSFLYFVLSVFICVHPWFQIPASAASQSVPGGNMLTGIDVLEAQAFAPLAGKRVGLITNQTGIDRNRRSTIDLWPTRRA